MRYTAGSLRVGDANESNPVRNSGFTRVASLLEPLAIGSIIVILLFMNSSTGNFDFVYAYFAIPLVYVPLALKFRKISLVSHFGIKKAKTVVGALYFATPFVTLIAGYLMSVFPLVSAIGFRSIAIQDVAAPVVEETVYRGYIYGTLRKYGKLGAAFVSAFLFFLPHARYGIPWDISALVFGLLSVAVFEYFGSILPSIVIHTGWNVLTDYQSLFGGTYSISFGALTLPYIALYLFAYAPFISLLVGGEFVQMSMAGRKRCWICGRSPKQVKKEIDHSLGDFVELKVNGSTVEVCPVCRILLDTSTKGAEVVS